MKYETVIGMEVHVELATASKMFCACSAAHFQVPANQHICPVCSAQPGALPVINERAMELTVMTGIALDCRIQRHSIFARKNYTYPDLPKGYQISQYELPLCTDGLARIETDDGTREVGIIRIHLEEDAGKLVHEAAGSLVDLNRAGVPLMEIVSDSSLRSAAEADAYLVKIRQLVRYLGASSGDMEKGAMRCEANISVRPQGAKEFGTKVEVKNLNSFRSVRNAIDYEVQRQVALLEEGDAVAQVTMGWNESAGLTQLQRSKETSEDYRYFPEPDLLDVDLSQEWIDRVADQMPELPDLKIERLASEYGLNSQDIALLVEDAAVADYAERALETEGVNPKSVSNWITGQLFRLLNENETSIDATKVEPGALAELSILVDSNSINQNAGREVLGVLWREGGSPERIVEERGLGQISDTSELERIVAEVIAGNSDAAEKIRGGNHKPIKFLMGQVMKATRGKANPSMVEDLIARHIAG